MRVHKKVYDLLLPILVNILLILLVFIIKYPWGVYLTNPYKDWPENYTTHKDMNTLTKAQVLQVYDGDTIEVKLPNNMVEKVRFLNIDTPETHHPRKGIQCYGLTASAKTRTLLSDKTVYLEKDTEDKDTYGRLLRFIYVQNPSKADEFFFVNIYLVAEGYAHKLIIKPNVKEEELFTKAEIYAKNNNKGLWSSCSEDDFK